MAPTLGYWHLRGICEPIRYLLHHTGAEFEDKRYMFKTEPPFDFGEWGKDKTALGLTFPNLPYLIDGETKITQSLAILRYLGRKHDLTATNEQEQIELDVVEQQVVDLQRAIVQLAYHSSDFEKAKDDYLRSLPAKLAYLESYVNGKKYVLGERLTYADFMLYEVLDQHSLLSTTCLDEFNNLKVFVNRMENLPNIKAYINSDKFKSWPIFAPFANFGGRGPCPK